ncbi:carbohydrate-binding family 9-like protein [Kiritimatiellota bacterium B12222]|nr:carbohydrate-binding family 9-like protein [Kiritimatiellota bacterium B12222]
MRPYFSYIHPLFVAMMAVSTFSGCTGFRGPSEPQWGVSMTAQPPQIDGHLEDLWLQTEKVDELLYPSDHPTKPSGQVESPLTDIWILWDADYLYFFFRCWDENIDFNQKLVRDDNLYKFDVCEVFIDPVGDARQWFEIQVSPLGQILDLSYTLLSAPEYEKGQRLTQQIVENDLQGDRGWTAEGIQVATGRLLQTGMPVAWTVEMAIPAETLLKAQGMLAFDEMSFRVNLVRYDWVQDALGNRVRNQFNWVPVLSGCPHISPARMGVVTLQK